MGPWTILRFHQRTSFYEVYAVQKDTDSSAHLYLFGADPDGLAWKRFVAETEQVRALEHPCLARVLETSVTESGQPYQVIALPDGENLGERLLRGALTFDETIACALQAGAGLYALHALDITHRGLGPEHLHLSRTDDGLRVHVLLAGVARLFEEFAKYSFLGLPEYLAPEQLGGLSIDIGPAADEYTLALILYQALSSSRPFQADTLAATITQVMHGTAEPLRLLRHDIPKPADVAILRAMAKDRNARFPTVRDFLAALTETTPWPAWLQTLLGDWLLDGERKRQTVEQALRLADSKPSLQVVALGLTDSGVPEVVEDQATVPNTLDVAMNWALPIEIQPVVGSETSKPVAEKAKAKVPQTADEEAEATEQVPLIDPLRIADSPMSPDVPGSDRPVEALPTSRVQPPAQAPTHGPTPVADKPANATKNTRAQTTTAVLLTLGAVAGFVLRQFLFWLF